MSVCVCGWSGGEDMVNDLPASHRHPLGKECRPLCCGPAWAGAEGARDDAGESDRDAGLDERWRSGLHYPDNVCSGDLLPPVTVRVNGKNKRSFVSPCFIHIHILWHRPQVP